MSCKSAQPRTWRGDDPTSAEDRAYDITIDASSFGEIGGAQGRCHTWQVPSGASASMMSPRATSSINAIDLGEAMSPTTDNSASSIAGQKTRQPKDDQKSGFIAPGP